MTGWIRNTDKRFIESELENLLEENSLLKDKIKLLEERILMLQELEATFKKAISNELGK